MVVVYTHPHLAFVVQKVIKTLFSYPASINEVKDTMSHIIIPDDQLN